MRTIAKPFGWLLLSLYNFVENYGLAILLFAVIVKLILLPFQMKSKKSLMRTTRLSPRLKELEKKYEGNKAKYQEEVARIYKEEKINPMSGCIWSLIPFPILIALYYAIREPLTTMMGIAAEKVTALTEWMTAQGYYVAGTTAQSAAYAEIGITDAIHRNWDAVIGHFPELSDKLVNMDYSFLGLNLGNQPDFRFWNFEWSNPEALLPALGLFLIPILSGVLSFLQMKVTSSRNDDQQQQQMKGMMYMMPLLSVYIGFIMPAALGIYWAFQYVLGIVQDMILNKYYGKIMDKEDAERNERFRLREEELERKRQETERLRAEGKTQQNPNTSKRKRQALERAKEEDRIAAEKEAKRIASGVEQPASQVGKRRYARGRAYVEDRYEHPETAEAATAAAAAESEFGASIDEDVQAAVIETPEVIETPAENAPAADVEPWEQQKAAEPWEEDKN